MIIHASTGLPRPVHFALGKVKGLPTAISLTLVFAEIVFTFQRSSSKRRGGECLSLL